LRRVAFPRSLTLLVVLALGPASTFSGEADKDGAPAFEFRQVKYFHRWSDKNQHEYTPDKQEDLDHWSDMITVNGYPDVHDGDGLAARANAVLQNYKNHQGKILKTNSVPKTNDRPAEHLIVVKFVQSDFVEIAFARFRLVANKGHSFVYSHRFHGDDKNEKVTVWLEAEGDALEKALMDWDVSPPAPH
jgi:hypothetical protein